MKGWLRSLFLFSILLLTVVPVFGQESAFIPITPENATQIRLLDTISDYEYADRWRTCELRLFSANGRTVATDNKIRDLVTGQSIDMTDFGYPVALSPDGTLALVAGDNTGTRLLDIQTGMEIPLLDGDADSAVFNSNGRLLALSSRDADAIQVWEVATSSLLITLGDAGSSINQLYFTPDDRFLVYTSDYGTIFRWAVGTEENIALAQTNYGNFAVSDDGSAVLINQYDAAEAWDIVSGERIARIEDNQDQSGVDTIALSPDRTHIAITYFGGNDRVELWDIRTTAPREIPITGLDDVDNPAPKFLPNSSYLLLTAQLKSRSCGRDSESRSGGSNSTSSRAMYFIDVETGALVDQFQPTGNFFERTFFSNDGHMIMTGQYSWNYRLWQLSDTTLEHVIDLPGSWVRFSPDETTIVGDIGISDSVVGIFGIETPDRPVRPFILPAETVPSSVSVRALPSPDAEIVGNAAGSIWIQGRSADSTYVYLPEQDGWIRADALYLRLPNNIPLEWLPVVEGASIALPVITPVQQEVPIATPQPEATPPTELSSLQLAVGLPSLPLVEPSAGLLRIVPENATQLSLLGVLPQSQIVYGSGDLRYNVPAISLDSRRLMTPVAGSDASMVVWDLQTFAPLYQIDLPLNSNGLRDAIQIMSPDGEHFAYIPNGYDLSLQLWSVNSETPFYQLPEDDAFYPFGITTLFSPNGRTLATPVGLIDVASQTIRASLDHNGDFVFSPDSQYLASVEYERVYVIDALTGEQVSFTERQENYLTRPIRTVFSPDSHWLATTSQSEVAIYQVDTGETISTFPINNLNQIAEDLQIDFSPDSQTLIAYEPGEGLWVFDMRTNTLDGIYPVEISFAQGDTSLRYARSFAFSPDGKLLAVGSPLRLIDLETGIIIPIEGNFGGSSIAFSPDGASLLVDSGARYYAEYRTVMVFGVPTDIRPMWQPLNARVLPSGINVRAEPSADAPIIGSASGTIALSGRNFEGTAVYVADQEGWIWNAPEYIDLGDITLDMLPVRVG